MSNMFQDNFKALRKQKGFTQEALAIQLHVVRQTVSKWEKGLSVPDADMLQRIAEVLEVDVAQLLGGELPKSADDRSAVVEQLAQINEQLAVRNRRARRVWRVAAVLLALLLLVPLAVAALGFARYTGTRQAGSVTWNCALGDEEYAWEIVYDDSYRITETTGDQWVVESAGLDGITDARACARQLEAFFAGQGGAAEVVEATGLPLDKP